MRIKLQKIEISRSKFFGDNGFQNVIVDQPKLNTLGLKGSTIIAWKSNGLLKRINQILNQYLTLYHLG